MTTCRGIVMGRLRSQQRQLEVELMRFCHTKLGAHLVARLYYLLTRYLHASSVVSSVKADQG